MKDEYKKYLNKGYRYLIELVFPESDIAKQVRNMSDQELKNLVSISTPLHKTFCLYSYQNPLVKEIVWQIKYYENNELTEKMGCLMADMIHSHIPNNILKQSLIIPLPLSKEREEERGYNQAEELAQIISNRLTIPYKNNLILKHRHTESQTYKNKAERMTNLKDSFLCTEEIKNIPPHTPLIILDDVITTGATTSEVTKILNLEGFTQIYRIALAH